MLALYAKFTFFLLVWAVWKERWLYTYQLLIMAIGGVTFMFAADRCDPPAWRRRPYYVWTAICGTIMFPVVYFGRRYVPIQQDFPFVIIVCYLFGSTYSAWRAKVNYYIENGVSPDIQLFEHRLNDRY